MLSVRNLLCGALLLAVPSCVEHPPVRATEALATIDGDPFAAEFASTAAAAERGDADAEYRLGGLHEKALGTEQDFAQAISWYRKAAEAGNARAAYALGLLLQDEDIPSNLREPAEPWLRRAAATGLAEAQLAEALLLEREPDREREAKGWRDRAAALGYPQAVLAAARDLMRGSHPHLDARTERSLEGLGERDDALGFWSRFMLWAVQVGHPETTPPPSDVSNAALSVDLEHATTSGQHWVASVAPIMAIARVKADDVTLRGRYESRLTQRLTEAASRGHLQSECNLAFLALGRKDYASAREWYGKAAQRGSARAAYHLGILYRDGQGVRANAAEAMRWFRAAATEMYPPAEAALGDMLLNGGGGGDELRAAIVWLRPAAAFGNPLAQYDLGLAYDQGRGVDRDPVRAAALMARAAGDFEFPAHEGTSRPGWLAAKPWLAEAARDPARAETVRLAIAAAGSRRRPDVDTADVDCLGRNTGELR